jgi:hypothetical protein
MSSARPSERDRNERSLKLLSEYLAAARSLTRGPGDDVGDDADDPLLRDPSPPPSTHTLPFRFVFYLAPEDEQGDEGKEQEPESPPPQLRKVELTLPPPERGRGARGSLSPAARRALRKLLSACGVPEPPEDAPDDERLRNVSFDEPDSDRTISGLEPGQRLADWLALAAEAARRGGGGGARGLAPSPPDAAVRVANLRGALRLSRGLIVGFSPDLRRALPAARQVALLSALIRVLAREDAALAAEAEDDSTHLDLRGLQVMFGLGLGVDGAGTVWLDASEAAAIEASVREEQEEEEERRRRRPKPASTAAPLATPPAQLAAAEEATEAWADLLCGLDPSHARGLRAAAEALRGLEASVARAMGVSAVVAGAGVAFGGSGGGGRRGGSGGGGINPSYRAFLERLAAHASSSGPVQAPVSDVPLVVVASGEGEAATSGADTTAAAPADAVTVPLSSSPAETYAFLTSRGPAAAEKRRRAQRERAERADRDERARRALGLRRLLRDPSLPPQRADQGVRALLRLRDQGGASLASCLEGMSVRVSDACRMPGTDGTDGSSDVVDVAWDVAGGGGP